MDGFLTIGLFFTYLGLYLMDGHGQPALLYLVPCTLGNYLYFSSAFLAKCHFRLFKTWVVVGIWGGKRK